MVREHSATLTPFLAASSSPSRLPRFRPVALRARALVHDKVTTRLRFFNASAALESWSVLDLAPVYRALRDALKDGVDDPTAWLDRDFDALIGERVEVCGLVAAPEFNGSLGTIERWRNDLLWREDAAHAFNGK